MCLISAAGISRSSTIVLSYLMRKYQKTYSLALGMLRKNHPQAFPNYGFISQLQKFEKSLGIHNLTPKPALKTTTFYNQKSKELKKQLISSPKPYKYKYY